MSDHDREQAPVDQRIADAAAAGCAESRLLLNRRAFLGVTAGFYTWAFMPRSAEAAGAEERLLVVVLRGGMDGLHVVPPLGDPNYHNCRQSLALDPGKHLPLDGFFYLNSCMPKFYTAYKAGSAAIVNAIAPPWRGRSHFECQFNLEAGVGGGHAQSQDGWMNRLLSTLPAGNAVKVDGLQVGPPPLILAGKAPVLAWSPMRSNASAEYIAKLQALYDARDPALAGKLRGALQTDRLANGVLPSGTRSSDLNSAFYGAGRLMSAAGGPRIAVLTVDSWDTHSGQTATLTTRMTELDNSLDDFRTAIGDAAWRNTVVVCVSEFGRTAWDMGRDGTDHGTGTVALLMGGAVAGGRVVTNWPGLAQNQLRDGRDLEATLDTRQLFKGLLMDHLGVPTALLDTRVFPDSAGVSALRGLIRS